MGNGVIVVINGRCGVGLEGTVVVVEWMVMWIKG